MIKNFDTEKFSPARAASVFTCAVWFEPDQAQAQYFHSWQDDLYKLQHPNGKTLYLVSHPRGLRSLQKMLNNFLDPLHRTYKPNGFCRAEIYENFSGNIVYARTAAADITDVTHCTPQWLTNDALTWPMDKTKSWPGKHRIMQGFESKQNGIFYIDAKLIEAHLVGNWKYWKDHSRYYDSKKLAA